MSIHVFMDKIKGWGIVDKTAILYLLIIVGVAASSFFLGRLSVYIDPSSTSNNVAVVMMK
ncbi:MAG: hypothetical protein WCK91_01830 [bacterium]